MTAAYYIETNLICIVLVLLLRSQLQAQTGKGSTDSVLFIDMLWTAFFMCVFDIMSWYFRGRFFPGARALIEIGNLGFFLSLTVIAYLWMQYVNVQLSGYYRRSRLWQIIGFIPLSVLDIMAITNPFTGFLFSIDASNLYHRGPGVSVHWIITGIYMAIATIQTLCAIAKEKSKQRRKEIAPLLSFIIAPIIASFTQMLFYGVTSSQVGVTISLLVIFLANQKRQILTDSLTGLNNRRGFDNHIYDIMDDEDTQNITLFLLDIDQFKAINDKYGHVEGDHALTETSSILKQACKDFPSRLFLCRFGGDEFTIIGKNCTERSVQDLKEHIKTEFDQSNLERNRPYTLSVSIGVASEKCKRIEDVEQLLKLADKAMYEEKKVAKEQARFG